MLPELFITHCTNGTSIMKNPFIFHNPSECFVIFSNSESVADILKLADTPKWVDTYINVTVDAPMVEIIPIIVQLLEHKALEEEEECEFIPMEEFLVKGSAHISTPKKGEEPVAPFMAKHIKSFQSDEL